MDANPRTSVLRLLSCSGLFSSLDTSLLISIAARMRKVNIASGTFIFARGDPGQELYLLTCGSVRLSISTSEGRELSFEQVRTGAVFGEIAVLDGGPRTADATAVTAVEAWILSRRDLSNLMRTSPDIAFAAVTFLCTRLRNISLTLEGVALHPIEVRLARFLAATLDRQESSAGAEDFLRLNMSQNELALLIGASRPKVNAALAALEAAGAIARCGGGLRCDRKVLRRLADMEL
ncbi:Crp/Fnr family transcriptional regulator [Methylobacterium sp. P31]